jgi:hypothetical protein
VFFWAKNSAKKAKNGVFFTLFHSVFWTRKVFESPWKKSDVFDPVSKCFSGQKVTLQNPYIGKKRGHF